MMGHMRHKLILQNRVRAPDGAGGYTESWMDVADKPVVYAAIQNLSATEVLRQRQLAAEAQYRVLIHYRDGVTPDMRLWSTERVYNIVGVLDRDMRKEYLEILATS